MKYIIITIAMLANVAAAIDDPCNNVAQANEQYAREKAAKEKKHYQSIASTLEKIYILPSKYVKSRNYMREIRDADGFLDFLLKNDWDDIHTPCDVGIIPNNAEITFNYLLTTNQADANSKKTTLTHFVHAIDITIEKLQLRMENSKKDIKLHKSCTNRVAQKKKYKKEIKMCNDAIMQLKKIQNNAKQFIE